MDKENQTQRKSTYKHGDILLEVDNERKTHKEPKKHEWEAKSRGRTH
jgi:hypothetical protein